MLFLVCAIAGNVSETENTRQQEQQGRTLEQAQIISDFLMMDSESFQGKYDRDKLYKEDILYCNMDTWKYQGKQLDAYQDAEVYYQVENISAIRFQEGTLERADLPENGIEVAASEALLLEVFENYAVSIYRPDKGSAGEVSFIRVEVAEGAVPKELYSYLEEEYYQVREEIQQKQWILSPEGTREACVSNGSLPKHSSQIFVRYQDKIPERIFRRTWECRIIGWIDENHLICYEVDRGPVLIHLENDQTAYIKKEEDDYDAYGADYRMEGDALICECMGEELYRWKIVSEKGEILLEKAM